MEYSAEQLNYFRICYVAFNLVPDGLRKIFKQEWDFRYKTTLGEWKDTPKNGADFYNNESRKSRSKNARYLGTIQNGNTAEWDCSCLFFAILFSDSIGTTLSAATSDLQVSLSMGISDEIEDATIAVDEPKILEIEATI